MRDTRRRGRSASSHDRWLIPYADFVTLLFAFFTALYAVTAVDATRLPSIAEGMRAAVGSEVKRPPTTGDGILPGDDALVAAEPPRQPDARAAIERELEEDLAAERLELVEDRRGLVLAIPEAFSFETGRADLSAVAEQLMTRVAGVLVTLPNAVRVEGHTDDTPIHTARFTSNWDLSTARATRVVAFFIAAGIAPDRLSAAGYSEFHPRAANDTPEGRARNRRVDIVILNQATAISEEPATAGAPPR
jgi:chemotaxis protein MotB